MSSFYPLETSSQLINEVLGPELMNCIFEVIGREDGTLFEDLISVDPEDEFHFVVNFDSMRDIAGNLSHQGRYVEADIYWDIINKMNMVIINFLAQYNGAFHCEGIYIL